MDVVAVAGRRRPEIHAFHTRKVEHAVKRAGEVIELHTSSNVGLRRARITGDNLRTAKRDGQTHVRRVVVGQREGHARAAVQQPLAMDHVEERIIFPSCGFEALRLDAAADRFGNRPRAEDTGVHEARERFAIHFRVNRHVAKEPPRPFEELALLRQMLAERVVFAAIIVIMFGQQ